MVPEGWDILPLGEMAEFRNGLNFTKGDEGQPIKIVTIPDFWQRTELRDLSGVKSIRPKGKVPEASFLRSGDMLFVRSNGNPELVGRCLFFPEVTEPVSFSGFTIRGRVDQERLVPEFAASVMVTERTKEQFRRGRGGGNISNLSQDILAGVQVALPPLPEQRKIADILSTWDAAIEKTEALLATAKAQKRALMQSLLTGKRRFPGFEGQPWKEVRLGDLGATFNGLTGKSKNDFGDGSPFIPYMNIFANSRIDLTHLDYVSVGHNERQNRVEYGDLFFTTSSETPNEIGMSSVLLDEMPDLFLNSFCFGFRLHDFETLRPRFARFFLRGQDFRRSLHKLAQGATRYNLSKTNLMNTKLILPPADEQEEIADALEVAQFEEAQVAGEITKLRTEKKALMQQLLTGKRRVVV